MALPDGNNVWIIGQSAAKHISMKYEGSTTKWKWVFFGMLKI